MASIKNNIVQKTLIVGPDKKFLILKRSKTDTRRPGEWDFPGGLLDDGESFEQGLSREIKEEAGISVVSSKLRFSKCLYFSDQNTNYVSMIYFSETNEADITLSYEHDEYKWVERSELLEYFLNSSSKTHVEAISYILDNNLDN